MPFGAIIDMIIDFTVLLYPPCHVEPCATSHEAKSYCLKLADSGTTPAPTPTPAAGMNGRATRLTQFFTAFSRLERRSPLDALFTNATADDSVIALWKPTEAEAKITSLSHRLMKQANSEVYERLVSLLTEDMEAVAAI